MLGPPAHPDDPVDLVETFRQLVVPQPSDSRRRRGQFRKDAPERVRCDGADDVEHRANGRPALAVVVGSPVAVRRVAQPHHVAGWDGVRVTGRGAAEQDRPGENQSGVDLPRILIDDAHVEQPLAPSVGAERRGTWVPRTASDASARRRERAECLPSGQRWRDARPSPADTPRYESRRGRRAPRQSRMARRGTSSHRARAASSPDGPPASSRPTPAAGRRRPQPTARKRVRRRAAENRAMGIRSGRTTRMYRSPRWRPLRVRAILARATGVW